MTDQQNVDIDIDESSELLFKVKIEGTSGSSASARLVVESNDLNVMLHGKPEGHDDIVVFTMPSMVGKLREGQHPAKIEVVVDDRLFVPVKFNINLKKTVKVVAEAVTAIRRQPTVSVTASPVVVRKSRIAEAVAKKGLLPNSDGQLVDLFAK